MQIIENAAGFMDSLSTCMQIDGACSYSIVLLQSVWKLMVTFIVYVSRNTQTNTYENQ